MIYRFTRDWCCESTDRVIMQIKSDKWFFPMKTGNFRKKCLDHKQEQKQLKGDIAHLSKNNDYEIRFMEPYKKAG